VLVASWAYAAVVLAALGVIRWVGEEWWVAAILLFLPRWLFLAPIPVLVLASGWARRPAHWLLQAATALVVVGPLMGFSVPFQQLFGGTPAAGGERFRIMTFNGGQGELRSSDLFRLIEEEHIDLICFQEQHSNPQLDDFFSRGWYRDRTGYIASRYPIVAELEPLADDSTTEVRYAARLTRARIKAPSGTEFILASVHLPTLRPGLSRFLTRNPSRLKGRDVARLERTVAWWGHEMERTVSKLAESRDTPFLVGGDFNMPADSSTMAALRDFLRFAFDEVGWGFGYTKPTRLPWIRIDHILSGPEWSFTRCWVGPDLGSDHLPLLAEVTLHAPARLTR
jgi:endonuclease/exonuclease/phosphatase (EEP) superfamily protein YafD